MHTIPTSSLMVLNQLYIERMHFDDKLVKGRGASVSPRNRFISRSYEVVEPEGVDAVEDQPDATRFLETHAKTILNKVSSPDIPFNWSMNPYQGCEHGCAYCYARPTHEYWGYDAGLDFERIVLVKRNAPELFRAALNGRRWEGEPISLSGATDPYQPRERKEQLTRRLLEVALEYGQSLLLITKNALILRDIDLLQELASRSLVQVAISLTTLNEDLRRVMEPRTSTGAKRLQTIEVLSEAKVPVMAMIAPIIPALNEQEIPTLLERASEAGAFRAGYTIIRTNGSVKPVFASWLGQHYPDRASKVLAQMAELHEGSVSDSTFGRRMKGTGQYAANIERLFKVLHRRFFDGRSVPELDLIAFKRPDQGQLDLFR